MFRCGSPGHSRAGRGFPIRTSWDQRSVINSPRLIADSYVLLRLLMPRHPPCALKNLTTKINKYYRYRENHDNTGNTPLKGTSPDHQVYLKLHLIILRCSRPLCSSQTTTPSHPSTSHHPPQGRAPGRSPACAGKPETTDPVASGPNSVPNDYPGQPPGPAFQPRKRGVLTDPEQPGQTCSLIFHP